MEDWKEYRLGEMIQCNPQVKLEKGKSYNLIDIDSIEIGSRYVKGKELTVYDGQSGCHFQNGDTVMARITPCLENGKIAQVQCESQKGFGSTELFVFRGTENKTDSDYVFNLMSMQFIRNLAANSMTGASGRQRADLGFIKRIKWNFPPLPTQKKIASILSAYDDLIQNYKKQIEALQTAASELYKEWFVRFRFPGYQTTNFENGIPEGWKVYLIKDLCYINKKTVSSKDAKKEILYLDTGSITENVIDSFESYILEEAPSRARRIVKKNSIIFSTVRPNQNHYGILKTVPENLIVSTGFAVFDPKFDIANILYFFLSSKDFVDYCQMIAEGAVATYPSIKPEEIGKVKILLPTMDLAIKLNHSFESLFLRIENLKQQITNLTQQRDLLLPRLMSGKLEV